MQIALAVVGAFARSGLNVNNYDNDNVGVLAVRKFYNTYRSIIYGQIFHSLIPEATIALGSYTIVSLLYQSKSGVNSRRTCGI